MARVHEFLVGHCTHPACVALKGAGLAPRCFPARAYLIETRAGLLLWDTGYAERFHDATRDGIYRLYRTVTPVYFDEKQALHRQLAELGVRPRDIQAVAVSHFHADHVAGLRDFPNSRIIAMSDGWETVRRLQGLRALRNAFLPMLMPDDIGERLQWVESHSVVALPAALDPFVQGHDISGCEEVIAVALPGHAVGHMGAFVRCDSGWMLLASDAAWSMESVRTLRGPSELSFLIQHRRRDYYLTLERLRRLHQSAAVEIRLSHEEAA